MRKKNYNKKLNLNISFLTNKEWFPLIIFVPVGLIFSMRLFLHPIFTLIFILLSIFQIWIFISLLFNKKNESRKIELTNFKQIITKLILAFHIIGANLFAWWLSYKYAQNESINLENLNLSAQYFFLLTNLLLIITFFISLALGKVPEEE
jgi:TRAP-type C4-dicarboxylate transport system permease large subunit